MVGKRPRTVNCSEVLRRRKKGKKRRREKKVNELNAARPRTAFKSGFISLCRPINVSREDVTGVRRRAALEETH